MSTTTLLVTLLSLTCLPASGKLKMQRPLIFWEIEPAPDLFSTTIGRRQPRRLEFIQLFFEPDPPAPGLEYFNRSFPPSPLSSSCSLVLVNW